ncbi:MAG: hypothetical protein ACYDGN_14280 [Acidimicrobiales bacterium]
MTNRKAAVGEIGDEVTRQLGDEGPGGMLGDPEDVHLPGRELDHQQYLEPL